MIFLCLRKEFFYGSAGKESVCNVGDLCWIPGLGRSPGEGKGYPLQYSGLENSMGRGAWQAKVHGVAKTSDVLYGSHFFEFYRMFSLEEMIMVTLCIPGSIRNYLTPSITDL